MHDAAWDGGPTQRCSCPQCNKSKISHFKKRLESSQPTAAPCPGSCFTPSCILELLFSVLLLPMGLPPSWRPSSNCSQPVSEWFLGQIMQEKEGGRVAFCPSEEQSSCMKISWLHPLSSLHLPASSTPKMGWFCNSIFWLIADVP